MTNLDLDSTMQTTPFEKALEIISEEMSKWKEIHFKDVDFQEQERVLAARTGSWIAPRSVIAGVTDIMSAIALTDGTRITPAQIEQLGNNIAKQLLENGLLNAQPRRGASLNP